MYMCRYEQLLVLVSTSGVMIRQGSTLKGPLGSTSEPTHTAADYLTRAAINGSSRPKSARQAGLRHTGVASTHKQKLVESTSRRCIR